MAISIIKAERGSGLQDSLEATIMRTQESCLRWNCIRHHLLKCHDCTR